jgi:hypothetical protein
MQKKDNSIAGKAKNKKILPTIDSINHSWRISRLEMNHEMLIIIIEKMIKRIEKLEKKISAALK